MNLNNITFDKAKIGQFTQVIDTEDGKGLDFYFMPPLDIQVIANNIRDNGHGLTVELNISRPPCSPIVELITVYPGSNTSRQKLVDQLIRETASNDYVPWNDIIEKVCVEVVYKAKHKSVELFNYSDIKSIEVTWLWKPYIPKNKLTILEGDPGIGKSWISLAISTAASLGADLPGYPYQLEPCHVLLLSAEDGIADTIRPRLDAMAADVSKIHGVNGLFTLDVEGCELIEKYLKEIKAGLVVIDPLVAYLAGKVDTFRANQVREVTSRLALIAENYDCAIFALRHLTKGGSSKSIYRGQGSIDFTASARSVLLAGEDPETGARAIVHIKSNLAPKGESIGYEIKDGWFSWTGKSDITASQILANEESKDAKQDAQDFLNEILANGPILSDEISKLSTQRGISATTLNRAKKDLKVESYREGSSGKRGAGQWYWKLPEKEVDISD